MGCAAVVSSPEDLARHYDNPPDGIRVNLILSMDGATAFDGLADPLSGPCDQDLLLALRGYTDVVLVGAETVRAERYGPVRLTADQRAERLRRWGVAAIPPIAVVTRSGSLPVSLFAEPAQRPLVVTTAETARTHRDLFRRADLLVAGDNEVDFETAIDGLRSRGFRRILCEGGPTLLDELISEDLVDEMCLTVSPTMAGTKSTAHPGAPALRAPARFALQHAITVDDYVYLRYRRGGGTRGAPGGTRGAPGGTRGAPGGAGTGGH